MKNSIQSRCECEHNVIWIYSMTLSLQIHVKWEQWTCCHFKMNNFGKSIWFVPINFLVCVSEHNTNAKHLSENRRMLKQMSSSINWKANGMGFMYSFQVNTIKKRETIANGDKVKLKIHHSSLCVQVKVYTKLYTIHRRCKGYKYTLFSLFQMCISCVVRLTTICKAKVYNSFSKTMAARLLTQLFQHFSPFNFGGTFNLWVPLLVLNLENEN